MKLTQTSSLRNALGIVTGLVTGFVAGLPIVVAAADVLPIISIVSPFQNQTVGSSVTLSVTSDSPGLVGLQFRIDGSNLGSEITSGSCHAPWDSTQATDGLHTIDAAARDQYGNVTLAQPVTVLVSNPPYSAPAPSPGPSPPPSPEPSPAPSPEPNPTPTPAPTPVSVVDVNIEAPLRGAMVSGSQVPIVTRFPGGSQFLSYTLRDRTTGAIRWSATGPKLSSTATSSSFNANLSTVPPGTYNLVVVCQRPTGVLMADVPLSVAPTLTTTLTATVGREFVATASLKLSGLAAAGVRVTFQVTNPLGGIRSYAATTDSRGAATVKGKMLPTDPRGTYRVSTIAIASGVTSTATAAFVY